MRMVLVFMMVNLFITEVITIIKYTEVTMTKFWIIYYGIICIVGLMVAFKQLKGDQDA